MPTVMIMIHVYWCGIENGKIYILVYCTVYMCYSMGFYITYEKKYSSIFKV